MKKRIITAVLMTALLAGCGKDAAESERSSRHDREEKEEDDEDEESSDSGVSEDSGKPSEDEIPDGKIEAREDGSGALWITVTQQVTERDDDVGYPIFRGKYPHINLDTPGYDKLDEVIERLNVSYYTEAEDTASSFVTDWSDYMDEDSFVAGESETSVGVCRADDTVVSLLEYNYSYLGGVHPNYFYQSKNFDTATGSFLSINDVLNSGQEEQLAQLIEDDLYARYEQDVFFGDVSDAVEEMFGMTGVTFTLGYDALTIYISPYEIAPYAYGGMVVELPYEDYPELVKEEYTTSVPEDYLVKVYTENRIRLRDGRVIEWTPNWNNISIETITFTEDGKEQNLDIYAFSVSMYVAYMGDKTYLYIDCERENAAHFLKCIDISGEKYTEANDEITGGFYAAPYNPDCVQFSTYCTMMSISRIWQYRLVTPDGQVVPHDGVYYFVNNSLDNRLTLTRDITVEYREEFMEGYPEELELSAGNDLSFYATDDATYVDFLLEGRGGYVRIYLDDPEAWPQTVDGVEIEELFDGIFFAD